MDSFMTRQMKVRADEKQQSANVKNEITAITNVTDKYKAIIENGDADPSTTLPQFNEELKSAGIDNIIEDMQKQVDEWLANK